MDGCVEGREERGHERQGKASHDAVAVAVAIIIAMVDALSRSVAQRTATTSRLGTSPSNHVGTRAMWRRRPLCLSHSHSHSHFHSRSVVVARPTKREPVSASASRSLRHALPPLPVRCTRYSAHYCHTSFTSLLFSSRLVPEHVPRMHLVESVPVALDRYVHTTMQ